MFGERFKKAREFLGENQSSIARKAGLTNTSIRRIENDAVEVPNSKYIQHLTERGINYFYLTGESEEITGELADVVSRVKYQKLENEIVELQKEISKLQKQLKNTVSTSEFEELSHKYQGLLEGLKALKLEVDENGELRKKTEE